MEWQETISDERSMLKWQDYYEELTDIAQHPFNINTITKEQLEQLPFLTDQLIENILYYIYKYGPMVSKNELLGVEGMDYITRRFLNDFIYIGPAKKEEDTFSWKHLWKYNQQDLLIRVDIPFNQKAGYVRTEKDEYGKKYFGNPYYQNLRYNFQYKKQIYWGLVAEKDAGEPFFQGQNKKGFDFYSLYFYLQNRGRLKSLAVGNYRASFGYGLVMNMDFSMGKTSAASALYRFGRGITKYTSTNEVNYLQGVGATYKLTNRWNASLFYSFRRMDATVDSMFIRTLKTDGYHRVKKDLEKQHTVHNHLIGGNLNYNGKYTEYGLTAVYNRFNKVLNPKRRAYNAYYPRGQEFYNIGLYGKWFLKQKFILSGEVAIDKKGKLAILQSLSYSPHANTTLQLINRYYDAKYQSLYAEGFRENSHTQNEIGSYIGLETSLFSRFKLHSSVDIFYFPYKRYRVDKKGTMGGEGIFQLDYSPAYSLNMFIKYSYKNKAQNYTTKKKEKQVIPYIRQRVHYQLNYTPDEHIRLKTFVEGVFTQHWQQERAKGFIVGAGGKWAKEGFPLGFAIDTAWFHTDNYDSRTYMYEQSLLYAFSMYSFYGKGTRMAVNAGWRIGKWFQLQAKWGWTHYFDRNRISSGLEEISGSNKMDLQLQLKLKW